MATKAKVISTRLDNVTGHDRLVIKAQVNVTVLLNVFGKNVTDIQKALDNGMEIRFDPQDRSQRVVLGDDPSKVFVNSNTVKLFDHEY